MARPSDRWNGFAHVKRVCQQYQQMENIISSTNFKYLTERALEARNRHQDSLAQNITCRIDSECFASGFNNVIFEVAFSDGVFWIARVQHQSNMEEEMDSILSEVATMEVVKENTNIPVPRVFDYDISAKNPFGYSYITMEYLEGHTLDGMLAKAVPAQYLQKVAEQFANVLFELQNLSFDRIGHFSCDNNSRNRPELIPDDSSQSSTSLEYFYTQRQEENREALSMHPNDPEWLTACWVLKTAIPHIIIENRVHGPFHLCHMDLHYGNLLFDDEFNLTGVLDWTSAQTVPLERLAVTPELITFPGLSEEENRPIVKFKELVVQALQEREHARALAHHTRGETATTLSQFLSSKRAEITHRCTYSFPHRALWDGELVAKLIYGDVVSWGQLKKIYGSMPYF
ncbi:hypothetical protein PRK78_005907 [Emydomyces testavorans]|uniref:Aminoglycoside phosphotransferase domain-containing protein n=1 Tax=Emydomyces testavorans TaxID=2070801 RepID=A0AAF0DKF8_9EURO|nr:hypothetical protein PRK78_005907 [Emydomyces testavorans]